LRQNFSQRRSYRLRNFCLADAPLKHALFGVLSIGNTFLRICGNAWDLRHDRITLFSIASTPQI
jgi:hypothetical protein